MREHALFWHQEVDIDDTEKLEGLDRHHQFNRLYAYVTRRGRVAYVGKAEGTTPIQRHRAHVKDGKVDLMFAATGTRKLYFCVIRPDVTLQASPKLLAWAEAALIRYCKTHGHPTINTDENERLRSSVESRLTNHSGPLPTLWVPAARTLEAATNAAVVAAPRRG